MVERSRSGRGPRDGSIFSSEDLGVVPGGVFRSFKHTSRKAMKGWCSKKRNPKR
jgi:hypothetical protein